MGLAERATRGCWSERVRAARASFEDRRKRNDRGVPIPRRCFGAGVVGPPVVYPQQLVVLEVREVAYEAGWELVLAVARDGVHVHDAARGDRDDGVAGQEVQYLPIHGHLQDGPDACTAKGGGAKRGKPELPAW